MQECPHCIRLEDACLLQVAHGSMVLPYCGSNAILSCKSYWSSESVLYSDITGFAVLSLD